jgi:hypothetical protein
VNFVDPSTQSTGFAVQQIAENRNQSAERGVRAMQAEMEAQTKMRMAEMDAKLAREQMQQEVALTQQGMEFQGAEAEKDRTLEREGMTQEASTQERGLLFQQEQFERDREIDQKRYQDNARLEAAKAAAANKRAEALLQGLDTDDNEWEAARTAKRQADAQTSAAAAAYQALKGKSDVEIEAFKTRMQRAMDEQVQLRERLATDISESLGKFLVTKDEAGIGLPWRDVFGAERMTKSLVSIDAVPLDSADEFEKWHKAARKATAVRREGLPGDAEDAELAAATKRLQQSMTPLQFDALMDSMESFATAAQDTANDEWWLDHSDDVRGLRTMITLTKKHYDSSIGDRKFAEEFGIAMDRITAGTGRTSRDQLMQEPGIADFIENRELFGLEEDQVYQLVDALTELRNQGFDLEEAQRMAEEAGYGLEDAEGEVLKKGVRSNLIGQMQGDEDYIRTLEEIAGGG